MGRIIQERHECLQNYPAVCGNGIKEDEEQCDCGPEDICNQLDPCCTPSNAQPPKIGCTFATQKGASCSGKESICCNSDCTINDKNGTRCFHSDTHCMISHCDGLNPDCPEPSKAPDKYPCKKTSRTCLDGRCNSSVCLDNNLQDCVCPYLALSCYICCLRDNECHPAYEMGFTTPWGTAFHVLEGTPCNGSGTFLCDGAGNCLDVNARRIDPDDRNSHALWWILTILFMVVVMLVFGLLHFLVKGSNCLMCMCFPHCPLLCHVMFSIGSSFFA
ncbi:disintegrin and metalloproteinase domain-containing protein 10 [Caerostris extrusa]|uniref:Disintegrin and metalloproteinase domain-containing protein 10 n=1 Tax=Caerostris extrusa TaxID=172846 RepID=A0AAV4Y8Y6_CAEEX|nr:disintegrin and metalloproteinase domain-containing protein 10 [Caerostris extrusa]